MVVIYETNIDKNILIEWKKTIISRRNYFSQIKWKLSYYWNSLQTSGQILVCLFQVIVPVSYYNVPFLTVLYSLTEGFVFIFNAMNCWHQSCIENYYLDLILAKSETPNLWFYSWPCFFHNYRFWFCTLIVLLLVVLCY